ncbi:MAG: enhanced serine sensitivity protein SseB [Erysipelotrichaceae bacterium]|jgi:hypothetical protein|nr:enhanced serine sensitivity protein SseB [Erysipelotrichaceae bacterium]
MSTNLIQAILQYQKTPSYYPELLFVRELRQARLLSPVQVDGEPDGRVVMSDLPKGTEVHYAVIKDGEGKPYLPVFTSDKVFHEVYGSGQWVINTLESLSELLNKSDVIEGFVIDPTRCDFTITKTLVKRYETLESEHHDLEQPQAETITLGPIVNLNEEMTGELVKLFEATPEVKQAAIALMVYDDDHGYLLGLEAAGDTTELYAAIAAICVPYLGEQDTLDIVKADCALGKKLFASFPVFYQK